MNDSISRPVASGTGAAGVVSHRHEFATAVPAGESEMAGSTHRRGPG